jgi:hypothetical protein
MCTFGIEKELLESNSRQNAVNNTVVKSLPQNWDFSQSPLYKALAKVFQNYKKYCAIVLMPKLNGL